MQGECGEQCSEPGSLLGLSHGGEDVPAGLRAGEASRASPAGGQRAAWLELQVEGGTGQQARGRAVTGWLVWEQILRGCGVHWFMGTLGAQTVKSLPAMREPPV